MLRNMDWRGKRIDEEQEGPWHGLTTELNGIGARERGRARNVVINRCSEGVSEQEMKWRGRGPDAEFAACQVSICWWQILYTNRMSPPRFRNYVLLVFFMCPSLV